MVYGEEVSVVEGVEGAGVQGTEELALVVAHGLEKKFVHGVCGQTRSLSFYFSDMNLPPRMMLSISSSLAVWSALAATLLAVQAVLLAAVPRLLLFLSNSDTHSLSPLESFLAQHFAIYLVAIALALLLNIPSPPSPIPSTQENSQTQPLLYPLTIAAILSAFLAWNNNDIGSLSSIFFFFSLIIGIWGLWEIVFANSTSISKTTGADKHTSAFIFGNKAAASSQKKNLKAK